MSLPIHVAHENYATIGVTPFRSSELLRGRKTAAETKNLKRILCIVGTRPECIKLAPVIQALKGAGWAGVRVIATGQHRELTRQTLAIFGIGIDHDLEVMEPDQTLASLSARVLERLDPLLMTETPDLVLAQGDTTTVLMSALGCFYRRIPFGHVEAGLRTHDLGSPFPEELNRVATSLTAQLHFAPTEGARANLLAERVGEAQIHVTGNTVIDALLSVTRARLPCAYPAGTDAKLILLTAHRRENFGRPLDDICSAVRQLHDARADIEIVYPVHPNPNVTGPVRARLAGLERVHLIEPVDYRTLAGLLQSCHFVLTDSGGIQEEAPALGKPVLVLRQETERPEAVSAGVALVVGTDPGKIVREANRLLDDPVHYSRMAQGGSPYGDGRASARIVSICRKFLGA